MYFILKRVNINYDQTTDNITPTISGNAQPGKTITLYSKPISDTINVYVDGGSFTSPYYQFYLDSSGTTLLEDLELNIDYTYIFRRLNNSNTHPFYISDVGYEEKSSSNINLIGDGLFNAGIKGSESFTLSFDESFDEQNPLYYYCSSHSSMNNMFMLANERDVLGTAVADSAGNWSITTSELSEGNYSVFAKSLDSDGNSASSDEITFSITAPIEGTRDTLTGQATFNLDVDGNGEVGALSDGLMILRKMFGTAFKGDALTDGAIDSDATRTTDEIHEYIQWGMDSMELDVDGNGEVGAFSDGLMVIRHLFGTAFQGEALTNGAISNDSPHWDDQEPWIAVGNNIDALM